MPFLCIFDLQSFHFLEMQQFPAKMKTKALGIKIKPRENKFKGKMKNEKQKGYGLCSLRKY